MGLTRRQYWAILIGGILLFLVGVRPVWRDPFDIDGPIGWSYLAVVIAVAGCLAYNKKLGPKTLFLASLELVLIKYGVTFSVAVVLWIVTDPPKRAQTDPISLTPSAPKPLPPEPSVIAEQARGLIRGRTLAHGAAAAGTLVWIDKGLERYNFAAPAEPLLLHNDGHGLLPELAALQVRQGLILETTDKQLHALTARTLEGDQLLNLPMVVGGRAKPFYPERALGLLELGCRVHEDPTIERRARLLVIAHPYAAESDAEGRFELAGVPAGALTIAAVTLQGAPVRRELTLEPKAELEVQLELEPAQ